MFNVIIVWYFINNGLSFPIGINSTFFFHVQCNSSHFTAISVSCWWENRLQIILLIYPHIFFSITLHNTNIKSGRAQHGNQWGSESSARWCFENLNKQTFNSKSRSFRARHSLFYLSFHPQLSSPSFQVFRQFYLNSVHDQQEAFACRQHIISWVERAHFPMPFLRRKSNDKIGKPTFFTSKTFALTSSVCQSHQSSGASTIAKWTCPTRTSIATMWRWSRSQSMRRQRQSIVNQW